MPEQNGQGIKAIDDDDKKIAELSFQRRATQQTAGGVFRWWFSQPDDQTGINAWWSPSRDNDLREFWMKPGNDILQGAIASLVKWGTTLPWMLEGPKRRIPQFQQLLSDAEFGQGWSLLIAKTLTDYYTQDKGATWELIGAGQSDSALEGPVMGIAHLDSQFVQPTGDPIYPILFLNPKDNQSHKIHATRVVRFVDMPSPNETMNGIGFCAVSRIIASSQVLLKLAQYKNEKLSDMPEAGLLLLNNVMPSQWEDATSEHQRGRRKLGQEIWSNILTLFSIDPAQPATANFVSFANLPEGFDELVTTNIYVNIVALAFGVDPREFWPMTGGSLGTARESETMAQKAKGKGKGDVISMLERAINWFILPENIHFGFDNQDDEEDKLRAEINDQKVKTIMSMFVPDLITAGIEPPVSVLELRQMLADNVPDYFKEEFLQVDISDQDEVTDTEKNWKVDRKGKLYVPKSRYEMIDHVLAIAEKNYKDGKISLDDLIEFRLGQILNGEEVKVPKHQITRETTLQGVKQQGTISTTMPPIQVNMPTPVFNVTVPPIELPAMEFNPVINQPAPIVNLPAPVVNVNVPKQPVTINFPSVEEETVDIIRDEKGLIKEAIKTRRRK